MNLRMATTLEFDRANRCWTEVDFYRAAALFRAVTSIFGRSGKVMLETELCYHVEVLAEEQVHEEMSVILSFRCRPYASIPSFGS